MSCTHEGVALQLVGVGVGGVARTLYSYLIRHIAPEGSLWIDA